MVAGDEDEEESTKVLAELENIDDECDDLGISFVMIDDSEEAAEYGVSEPGLIFFENKIPTIYSGNDRAELDIRRDSLPISWLTRVSRRRFNDRRGGPRLAHE